ncbi:hypothetical protein C8J57DRAFT_1247266 [Mycena rebaudengoi]|nr:hypothetical protein C8J57DRAFT_1247266 [Mycena rebaudengoi]
MVALGEEEGRLRKGEAYDFIRVLQTVCRTLSALEDRKRVDEAGQNNHTIAGDQVLDTRDRRDYFIESYNAPSEFQMPLPEGAFPHLTVAQTFMKSRRRERALGDSRRGGSTQMTMRKKKKPPAARKKDEQALQAAYYADPKNKNGWLWELRKPSNMTNEEMKQWEEEGDRVQWARAEADMDRFQEQMEAKLAEFLRCSVAFHTNAENWTKMSAKEERGYGEYARQTAAMWLRLATQSEDHLCKAGYKFALKKDFNFVVNVYLESERDKHDGLLRDRGLGKSFTSYH